MKIVRIRSFSGPYFPAFRLILERDGVCSTLESLKNPDCLLILANYLRSLEEQVGKGKV